MKRLAIALALVSSAALAEHPGDQQENRYTSPTVDEVELLSVEETPPVESDRPLQVRVQNNSSYYLDRVAIECDITDAKGFRAFKDIVFKSSPVFSIKPQWPPITTQQIGIPPGATATVGLYTEDQRWTKGLGNYAYDCHVYGTGGQE